MTTYTVPGEPRGKGRPRFTRLGKPYTDAKTRAYEALIRDVFRANGGIMAQKPVMVSVCIYHGIPKSWSKSKRQMAEDCRIIPTCKPDIDNVAKILLDALNGIAWRDDTLVTGLALAKCYTSGEPCIAFQITDDKGLEGVCRCAQTTS